MSILLSTLVTELQGRVAARNSVPTEAQYQKAIKNAVADFSQRCSREKISTLNVVSGTASYNLPADFVKMIRLYFGSGIEVDGVMIAPNGLIPMRGLEPRQTEYLTYAGGQVSIYPTPDYSLERTLRYAAGWALSGVDPAYADLTETEAAMVLLKAEAECLTLKLNAEGGGVTAYRIGDESYDKSGGIQAMTVTRDTRQAEYLAACERYNGAQTVYGGL
jgi:hypothetical protein